MITKKQVRRDLLTELQKSGAKATEDYGFYEGSLVILIEDLNPFLKQAGICKKDWMTGVRG